MTELPDTAHADAKNKYYGKVLTHCISGEQYKVVDIDRFINASEELDLYLRLKPKNFFLASLHVPVHKVDTDYLMCDAFTGE